jgi:hypothetical protein
MSKESQAKKIQIRAARRAARKFPVSGSDNSGEEEAGQPTSAEGSEGLAEDSTPDPAEDE